MGQNLPSKMDMTEIKISLAGPLLHLNKIKEQILGGVLGEDVVDAKIMHQCIKVL